MFETESDTHFDYCWRRLCSSAGFSDSWSSEVLVILRSRYSEPGRHYHTLRHICQVLTWLEQFDKALPVALQLAAFFHDAVYDTKSKFNEEMSAQLAVDTLGQESADLGMIHEVRQLILCTKKHLPDESNAARSGLFLDCDLMILAASPAEYKLYTEQIRLEYSQFNDVEYRAGRTHVLKSFISRKTIFFTERVRLEYERGARSNITHEIELL